MYKCPKCDSEGMYIKVNGTQKGLYCMSCGRWIKWLNKNEYRLLKDCHGIREAITIK